MTLTEAYLFLFFDSIMASLILVPNTGMVYELMLVFKNFNQTYMFIIAVCGNTIGSSINYILGKAMRSIKQKSPQYADSKKLVNLASYADSKLFWLAAFSSLTLFGVVITTAAGFLNISYRKFLLAVVIGRVVYYTVGLL